MLRSRKVVDAKDVAWDDTYDVLVVGAGAAGFPAALNASRHGASAAILEKAAEPGGTMKKSAAWYWIPNNTAMREAGLADEKEGFIRYCARLSRPQAFDASASPYGLSEWEFETTWKPIVGIPVRAAWLTAVGFVIVYRGASSITDGSEPAIASPE